MGQFLTCLILLTTKRHVAAGTSVLILHEDDLSSLERCTACDFIHFSQQNRVECPHSEWSLSKPYLWQLVMQCVYCTRLLSQSWPNTGKNIVTCQCISKVDMFIRVRIRSICTRVCWERESHVWFKPKNTKTTVFCSISLLPSHKLNSELFNTKQKQLTLCDWKHSTLG